MKIPEPSTQKTVSGWPWTVQTDPAIYESRSRWPKISIITPSYNQGEYLEQTIRSVLMQNYPNLEYIIIDGGSTDESVEIIKKYGAGITFWISERDRGQSDALNKGLRLATGEIVGWINSDDYYEKDALFTVADQFKKTGFSFFCGSCEMIDEDGKPIQRLYTRKITHASLIRYWKPHFCPPQPSIFFRRRILNELGELDVTLRYAMDYDIWLRASKKYAFHVVRDNISYYRVHHQSKTGSTGGMQKFIPEWKMLIDRSLEQEPVFIKWNYAVTEKMFLFIKGVRRVLRHRFKISV